MAVGRRRLQLVVGDVEEDAHQIIAGFLARDGEAGLVDDLAQRRGGKLEAGRQLALGDHREIVARQGRQVEARAPGDDLHLALGGGQLDLAALGKLADDVEQGVRGTVVAPACATWAGTLSSTCRSRSVAISRSEPSSRASISTLDRIGMVLRRSTTDWTWPRLFKRVARSIVAFMPLMPLRDRPMNRYSEAVGPWRRGKSRRAGAAL